MASQSKKMRKTDYMRKLHGRVARDAANLRERHKQLDEKEKFLRSEVLLHQANIVAEEQQPGDIMSTNSKLELQQDQLKTLKKHLECAKKASCLGISRVKYELEQIEGLEEGLNFENNMAERYQSHGDNQGLVKSVQVEGDIDQFHFKLDCSTSQLVENRRGEITQVHQLDINPLPDIVKRMMKKTDLWDSNHVTRLLSNLHYLQMLEEERTETAQTLESTVEGVFIKSEAEPVELEFYPTQDQVIKIHWSLNFDSRNVRLRYEISITCTEDVMAYYSQRENIYPYLNSQKVLETSEDVLSFINSFL